MRLMSQLIVSNHLLMEARVNHSIGSSLSNYRGSMSSVILHGFLHPQWCSISGNQQVRQLAYQTDSQLCTSSSPSTSQKMQHLQFGQNKEEMGWTGFDKLSGKTKKLSQACVENIPRPFWERNHPWDSRSSYFVVTSSRILVDIVFSNNLLIWLPHSCRSALDQLPVLMQPEVVTFWNVSVEDLQLRYGQGFKLPCYNIMWQCENIRIIMFWSKTFDCCASSFYLSIMWSQHHFEVLLWLL